MSHQSELIGTDILAYLAQHERKGLLRLLTCGNVDDGKSTLIGRLLHDSKMIYEDQLAAVRQDSTRFGTTGDDFDPALLMDGLQAEREQGITIDVAYRYFSTAKRKFIIADTPGHEQYTRNMATGASNCDLAIILIDARHGVRTQTKRHSFIVSLLGIRHVIVAVNKMDLVGHDAKVFEAIRQDYLAFAKDLNLPDIHFIPLSALKGDNVVNPSASMPWYVGQPLMELLNRIEIDAGPDTLGLRFPVQWVNRPNLDFRGFSGTLAAGTVKPGDTVRVLPSRKTSRVRSIVTYDGELAEAFPPQAVTLTLEDEIDASRGDMLVSLDDEPTLDSRFLAHVVWMAEVPLTPAQPYYVKQTSKLVSGSVAQIHHRIDVNTLAQHPARQLKLNEIGLCELALNAPIAFDPYTRCKATGSFIIIDRLSHVTVAAGMILGPVQRTGEFRRVSSLERSARLGQKGVTFWLVGEGAEESAYALERRLFDRGYLCVVLAGGRLREQTAWMADEFNAAGLICLCAAAEHAAPAASETHVLVPAGPLDLEAIFARIGPPENARPDFDI